MEIVNKWKFAFWALFAVFLIESAGLACFLFIHVNSIENLKWQNQCFEFDLEQLSDLVRGKMVKEDFKVIFGRYQDEKYDTLNEVGLNQIRIVFDSLGKLDTLTTKWY